MRPIFLKPGQNLVDFLTFNKFTYHDVNNNRIQFFVNKKGNQVKVDHRYQQISLIDKRGDTYKTAKAFTEKEVLEFAEID